MRERDIERERESVGKEIFCEGVYYHSLCDVIWIAVYIPFEHGRGLVHGIVASYNSPKTTKHFFQNILQLLHPVWTNL